MATTDRITTIRLGAATVTVISVGELQFDLAESLQIPQSEWFPQYRAFFEQPLIMPIQCIYVEMPDVSLLIDASTYELPPPYALPNYQPPPDLLTRLAELGVQPGQIQHVIITHLHTDHFSGTTVSRNGRIEPCFPNARHYVARADWNRPEIQQRLQDSSSVEGRTLAVLQRHNLLEFVDGRYDIGHGIQIIPAPGETPGHQIVRLRSTGQILYGLGDLYHHPLEAAHPEWNTVWADGEASTASRAALAQAALSEEAQLVASHISNVGRLRRTETGVEWVNDD